MQEDVPSPPAARRERPLVHAPEVWAKGIGGADQVIAVLDTGVAKIASDACRQGRVGGVLLDQQRAVLSPVSLCPGRVIATTAPGSGVNCPVSVPAATMALTWPASRQETRRTLDGIASGAKLIAIQGVHPDNEHEPRTAASSTPTKSRGCSGFTPCATRYKIAAVNMSIGGGKYADGVR